MGQLPHVPLGTPAVCMLVELVCGGNVTCLYLMFWLPECQCPEQLPDLEPGTEDNIKPGPPL